MRRLITTGATAKRIDRTPDRVRQEVRAGRLRPEVITSSGQSLFTDEEVARYLRERAERMGGHHAN